MTPPPLHPCVVSVLCVFRCGTAIHSADPWAAHEVMEKHYRDRHGAEIAAAMKEAS